MLTAGDVRMKSIAWYVIAFVDCFVRVLVLVTQPVFRWLYDSARRGLPPVHSDLLMKSGVELAAMIRRRQVCKMPLFQLVLCEY